MTHQDLTDQANVCYCENQVFFIVLSIIRNESKTKTIQHTFFRRSLSTILDTKLKRFHGRFFELEMRKHSLELFY